MKKSILILFFVLSNLIFSESIAQDIKFSRVNAENGLSANSVFAIEQDQKGFLWFGTEVGLNKYDGKKITIYQNNIKDSNSLSDNLVRTLFSDKNGVLWIGTDGGGLNFYDPVKNNFKKFIWSKNSKNCLSNNTVRSIVQDLDGLLWIGTDNGLNSFNSKTGQFVNYINDPENINSIPNHQIYTLFVDKKGIIWIGTSKSGLISFDKKKNKFESYSELSSKIGKNDKEYSKIKSIYEDSKNNLWIGTEGGLCQLDRSTDKFLFFSDQINCPEFLKKASVFSVMEESKGEIWISTKTYGLIIFNPKKNSFRNLVNEVANKNSISANDLYCVFEDKAKSLWVATVTHGLSVFHRTSGQFGINLVEPDNPYGIQSPSMCFLEDGKGLLFLGSYGSGIYVKDLLTNELVNYNSEKNKLSNNILSLFDDNKGNVWIGSWGKGFNFFDKKTKAFSKPFNSENSSLTNDNVTCMHPKGNSQVWIGTLNGLNLFDLNTRKIVKTVTQADGLSAKGIYCLYQDKDSLLWIGTRGGGLNSLNLNSGKIITYQKSETENSISNDKVTSIHEDLKGNLWIGTYQGLNKFNKKTKKFTYYFEKDGLSHDKIFGIIQDNNENLWISTHKGLSKLNTRIQSENEKAFINYYSIDGLQSNEFNQCAYHKGKSGKFYFGGINGFNSFFPDKIIENLHKPPIVITSFSKFRKEVVLDTAITCKKFLELSHRDNFIEFEFAALDYLLPEKNLYSFKMEGQDENWTTPSYRNYASYTNLSGGDYVFRVRGSNNDGVWNNEGTSILIRVNPPFYKTAWFIILIVLLTICIIAFYIKYRTDKIENEKKILEEKVQERTIELAEKNKDITSSIHYAQRIQNAILPDLEYFNNSFPDSFILYKPKDIVSGDFYWFSEIKGKKIFAVVDCTGHGVPGAFMSMIGHNLLNQIVIEKGIIDSDQILNELNNGVQKSLKQDVENSRTTDGMDVVLCVYDESENTICFSGAYRPLYILNNQQLRIIDPNKFPIGGNQFDEKRVFSSSKIDISSGDAFYLFSDGYADQFGGESGKKFMTKRFQNVLREINHLPMPQQSIILEKTISEWMGNEPQVDDILIVGVKF